jgi:hypothetical protein
MEFRVDSPTGPVVASVAVPSTGSFDTYATLPAVPVADPGGTHDLYVVFTDDNMDLDEFTLLGAGVTSVPDPGP